MNLGLGQLLVKKEDRSRWQIVLIGPAEVKLRRVVLTDTGGDKMTWLPPVTADESDFATTHRGHIELLYEATWSR